jgi:hypothetical protein
VVLPFAAPGIQGLSVFGGFQHQLLDPTGGDVARLAETAGELIGTASGSRVTPQTLQVCAQLGGVLVAEVPVLLEALVDNLLELRG